MSRYEDCFQAINLIPTDDDHYTAEMRFRDPNTGHEWTELWDGTTVTDMSADGDGNLRWTLNLNLFPDFDPTFLFGKDTTR